MKTNSDNTKNTVSALSLTNILLSCPDNQTIVDNYVIADSKVNSPLYERIAVALSGGSDSDIVADIISKCDRSNKVQYIFFNTGLEMSATIRHLDYLEERYGIEIQRIRPKTPIPTACRNYGIPFLNKRVSDYMSRLQKYGFKWEDKPIDVLLEQYCEVADETLAKELDDLKKHGQKTKKWTKRRNKWYKGCVSALEWWCNCSIGGDENSMCNIQHNKYLKEFIMSNPPDFQISSLCCTKAKKEPANKYCKEQNIELNIMGVRKAEGGQRQISIKSCFSEHDDKWDVYRPVFFYSNKDKEEYERHYQITHSECYTKYGLKRTGCCGCPCSLNLEKELEAVKKFEPKLYRAIVSVFGKSYEYTKAYRNFVKQQKETHKE